MCACGRNLGVNTALLSSETSEPNGYGVVGTHCPAGMGRPCEIPPRLCQWPVTKCNGAMLLFPFHNRENRSVLCKKNKTNNHTKACTEVAVNLLTLSSHLRRCGLWMGAAGGFQPLRPFSPCARAQRNSFSRVFFFFYPKQLWDFPPSFKSNIYSLSQ